MTVGQLVALLKQRNQSLPVEVLDKGSDTRDFAEYRITKVEVGTAGTGSNPPKTCFIEVVPK